MANGILIGPATTDNTSQNTRQVQAQILEMRTAGISFEHIARELGYTKRYCFKIYEKALNAIIHPGVENLRTQEGERLDTMLLPLMTKIMDARNKALTGQAFETPINEIMVALRISERRAKIFGLDAPTKSVQLPPKTGPDDILSNLNLSTMDTAELVKFRDLLAKAHSVGPVEEQAEYDADADS